MGQTAVKAVLKADRLTKSYGTLRAVDSISFEVNCGEVFGFLGPNGAGKTTTMKMLAGLMRPDSGRVEIDGSDICGKSSTSLKSIGICPQEIVVWEGLTCLEQLVFMGEMYGMARHEAKKKSLELLDVFGLMEKRDRLAKTLSGGMQRRLNIILALVHSPQIAFLDEPQAGLDPQSRVLVREYIRSIKDSVTVILTTHDMEEAEKLSDRVCIIDRGRVLATGTVDEIKKSLGQGDFFEVKVKERIKEELLAGLKKIKGINSLAQVSESTFTFLSDDIDMLGGVMQALKQRNVAVDNFSMRQKSLEDVFITLTGRGLRE